jgi:DNA-binding response OmpR family regulator
MVKILVVDDEQEIRAMLAMALSRQGWGVETAANGIEGICKFDREAFDLVITDIQMPMLDGRGLVRHIRSSERPRTPTLGLTGTPWALADSGFDGVLAKPLPLKTLYAEVRRLTRSRQPDPCPDRAETVSGRMVCCAGR